MADLIDQDSIQDFVKEFQNRVRKIDKVDKLADIEIPIAMQTPTGELYSVFKRSNLGCNQKMLINLPLNEAKYWSDVFNTREYEKRNNMPNLPDEVYFYEFVQGKTEAEDVYWNPKLVVFEE